MAGTTRDAADCDRAVGHYNLPKYGTDGELVLLDCPEENITARNVAIVTGLGSATAGANLQQLAKRGFFEVVKDDPARYELTEQGENAKKYLTEIYGEL